MWSPNEDEIFYRNGDQMVAVPVDTDSGFDSGTPSVLFEGSTGSQGARGATT